MIPTTIETHLREHHGNFKHTTHRWAVTAQELAAVEHVKGKKVAKPVVIRVGGKLAMAVVSAPHKVNLGVLEEAMGANADLVPEAEFKGRFAPCEPGAEPPLALFGLPIFVDEELMLEPTLVMQAGTHEDAIELTTGDWIKCEGVQPVAGLGMAVH